MRMLTEQETTYMLESIEVDCYRLDHMERLLLIQAMADKTITKKLEEYPL